MARYGDKIEEEIEEAKEVGISIKHKTMATIVGAMLSIVALQWSRQVQILEINSVLNNLNVS